jgi:hypothetical protein
MERTSRGYDALEEEKKDPSDASVLRSPLPPAVYATTISEEDVDEVDRRSCRRCNESIARRTSCHGDDHDHDDDDDDDDVASLDDPYIYSDDSASLSDAYFLPTDDDELALPPRYREQDPLPRKGTANLLLFSSSSRDYGSVNRRDGGSAQPSLSHIQEDAPGGVPLHPPVPATLGDSSQEDGPHTTNRGRPKNRKKCKGIQRRLRVKQLKQLVRERAITQIRGKQQDRLVWKDTLFAVIFVIQWVLVLLFAAIFGFSSAPLPSPRLRKTPLDEFWSTVVQGPAAAAAAYTDDPGQSTISSALSEATAKRNELEDAIALVGVAGFYSGMLAFVSFGCMLILARTLLQTMLLFSVLLSLAWGLIGLTLDPYGAVSIMGFLAIMATMGYTIFTWGRIGFASANLYIALCGIRCTADVIALAMSSLIAVFGWCIAWSISVVGALNTLARHDCGNDEGCDLRLRPPEISICFLFLASFLWTNEVIKNIVQVTVAGAIGSWWCHPEEIRPFCASAVSRPLLIAMSSSFGSVCLGSLVVGPALLLSTLGRCCCYAIGNPDCGGKLKVSETAVGSTPVKCDPGCLSSIRGSLVRRWRSYNRWSFTYIGLYGYGFHEAGERAVELFETREWLEIVSDSLIHNILLMACVVLGGSAGTFAVVLLETDGSSFSTYQVPTFIAFLSGSIIGYVLSSTLLVGVVGSAVNAVLVCFASFPFEFDLHHRRLSNELREAWSQRTWDTHV